MQQMDAQVARDISRGLQGLERVVQEHGVNGVYGRLIDLIDCAPQLNTAVEVTAGE
jgi:structural maintenance of chromosome 3 (chondroitin sulfate proteoglycan 6)